MDLARERRPEDEVAQVAPAQQVAKAEPARDQEVAKDGSHQAIDDAVGEGADKDVSVEPAGKTMTLGGGGHVWIKGDTLWNLSKYYYGEGKHWRSIQAANAAKVKKGLKEGMVLDIPAVEIDTLVGLLRFKDQPKELCNLVKLMPLAEYEGFFAQLTPAQIDKHAEFLQVLELMRATGKTVKELAADQRQWLKDKAASEKTDVGESVGNVVETEGYGGGKATEWNKLDAKQRKEWKHRFQECVKSIKTTAPADVQEIITTAEAKSGGFRWSPKEVEENGAFAYTQNAWDLHCGQRWVLAAEQDPMLVYGNIAHEMGGHNYYGNNELGYAIQKGAMTAKEEKAAEKSGNSIFSAYGYMETEIFAELYEYKYNLANKKDAKYPSDTAFDTNKEGEAVNASKNDELGDVHYQLTRIKNAFEPGVASGLVASLARRVELDPRILPEAKERFERMVMHVFIAPP
jgi:hypothetical protein